MEPNERYMLYASTGGGKTTMAAFITLDVEHLAVYDPKRDLDWLPDSELHHDLDEMTFAAREVFQPPPDDVDDVDLFNEFCRRAYLTKRVMLWLDESSFVTTSHTIPSWLKKIVIAGRSRGVGLISLTQSGAGLSHPILVRQAEHVFVGYGNDEMLETIAAHRGSAVWQATGIEQFSGEFMLFESNSKVPIKVGPIDVKLLGDRYRHTDPSKVRT